MIPVKGELIFNCLGKEQESSHEIKISVGKEHVFCIN